MGLYSGKLPGGNIHPSRFVKLQSDDTIVEAGAGDDVWAISGPSTRYQALAAIDDGFAGILGDGAIVCYGPGDDECLLELGGTVTEGQNIKPSTAGVGIAATTDKDRVGAKALRSGVSGDLIRVRPFRFDVSI